jgi:GWxTD domain-containing protein
MNSAKFLLGLVAIAVVLCLARQVVAQSDRAQLSPEYSKWLNEDVHWIITSQERTEFLSLHTDQARNGFIVDFWERRNPTPGSQENPFKEEHYRRLAFANQHFAAGIPGWKTDRGHIYIVDGPPDEIVSNPGSAESYPSQVWHYLQSRRGNTSFDFVDACRCGDYRLRQ